jgi:Protein of unknown function (DUF2924)
MRSDRKSALEAEIVRLDGLGLDELRQRWGELLGPVPKQHSAGMLRRRIAYELQARTHGDLSADARRRLRRLHGAFAADPTYTPVSNLGLTPGAVLTREWQGGVHQVVVMDKGLEYRGERFSSLSEVATRITGTRWSGPAFFGLKGKSP